MIGYSDDCDLDYSLWCAIRAQAAYGGPSVQEFRRAARIHRRLRFQHGRGGGISTYRESYDQPA